MIIATFFVGLHFFGTQGVGYVLEKAIGAPVSVGRFEMGLFSSSIGLHQITIKNPKGFHEKTLAEIHEISVKYDLPAFFRGKVHLKEIRLDFGDVTIEKNASQVNLLELGAVKGMTKDKKPGREKTKSEKPAAKKGPALQIDEVFVNIGKVRYVDSAAEPPSVKEYDLGLHNETFKNVTQSQDLVKGIAFLILRKVGMSSLNANFDMLMKGVGGEIQSTFQKLLTSASSH